MKSTFLLLTLTFSLYTCFAQNLVPNPSFEQYDTCPNNVGQIGYAIGWFNSGTSSVDYFNSCSNSWGVPSNSTGFQYAANGMAYAGFYAYWWPNYKGLEYFGCQLKDSLIIYNTRCAFRPN